MTGIDVKSIIVVGFKYRYRALAVVAAAVLIAIAVSSVMQTQYAATAKVLVKLGRELVYRPDVGSTSAALPTMDKDNLIASNVALISSPEIANAVIDEVGLSTLYPDLVNPPTQPLKIWLKARVRAVKDWLGLPAPTLETRALEQFSRKLSVQPVKKTDMIGVTFMHPDPEIAARVANRVVALFQQKTGEIYANPNLDFMEKSVAQDRAGLEHAEAALNEFRQKNATYAFDSQMDMLLRQRMEIDAGLKGAEARIAELTGMVAVLSDQLSRTPQTKRLYSETERHRSTDDAQTQLNALKVQERQMATRYSDSYQPLAALRAQIQAAEGAVAATRAEGAKVREGVNETYQDINQEYLRRQADLTAALGRRDELQKQLGEVEQATALLATRKEALQQLEREAALRNDSLKVDYAKLIEARAVAGLNREKPASFSLVEAASPPDPAYPARPLPVFYTLAAAVAGVLGGLCVIFFSYRLSGTFVTPEQVARRLKLPVLAVIDLDRRHVRNWTMTPVALGRGPEIGFGGKRPSALA